MEVILGALIMLVGIIAGALIVVVVHKTLDTMYVDKHNFRTNLHNIPDEEEVDTTPRYASDMPKIKESKPKYPGSDAPTKAYTKVLAKD